MSLRRYFPSASFAVLVGSLALSVGLVYAAQLVTKPYTPGQIVADTSASAQAADHANWEAALQTIQAQDAPDALPSAPDQSTVNALLAAAKSSNVTDTVARSLLVNLGAAKAQGMGSDIPTQNQIISQALNQVEQNQRQNTYTLQDLTVVDSSKEAEHTYGNVLATLLAKNSDQEYGATMVIIDNATSQNDASQLKQLQPIAKQYQALAAALRAMPVPQTLAPFHLQLVNNFTAIANSYTALGSILNDPLQGLSGLQTYQSLTQETVRVFINIAQSFNKDGILFSKDEPGASWSTLLSAQQ